MLTIRMYSSAAKVDGQGVGSAYSELIDLLEKHYPTEINLIVNRFGSADVSHYHTIDPQFYLSTFSPKSGRKVGYVHFLPETMKGSLQMPALAAKVFNSYMISFYKRMDALVVVNPSFIPKLVAYGIAKNKITYIPNFVSKKEFYPLKQEQKNKLRAKHGLDPHKFTVIGVGQVQARKGLFDFIKLAQQLPDVQFVWVGGFSFGKMTDGYNELKKVVDDPPANLFFPGIVARQEMNEYYNLADLFLLPSYNELFPMSVLEAFSCEVPVLLRDLDLYHSILTGYYEPAVDVVQMKDKIEHFKADRQALGELKDKAVRASAYYNEDHMAEVWREYYTGQAKLGR
ncbi:glycosyltransferase family 4 protein [Ligilactobacillus acidipiscis]|jgi:1,2-diacylglycerol-3-alpha-glucose alpha-1,2-galactosyltransferase|uniref:glycosyltransferase family 4 protein n=1 Tax=Ligilactobacillus acidipiscis TaxID=89059 RepID=UPI002FDAE9E1|nr:glycosyltransferase family 4 protein [Ligilactobacillus acidipiscis]